VALVDPKMIDPKEIDWHLIRPKRSDSKETVMTDQSSVNVHRTTREATANGATATTGTIAMLKFLFLVTSERTTTRIGPLKTGREREKPKSVRTVG